MSHTFHRYKVGDEPVAGYRLEEHLGAGGFGEVWKALAPGGTEVALKIIDLTGQQGVQEFASLRVVKKVRHPNLISLQAFWMKDESGQIVDEAGQGAAQDAASSVNVTMAAPDPKRQTQSAAIAMTAQFSRPVELIIAMQLGAKSLYKRLEECREQSLPGVPVAELLELLEQSARGIDFLNKPIHDMGKGPVPIVHGDIKPHNILVVGDAAVVCDFGLARAVETLRKTSMAPVTVAYAAPESFKGKVTPTSDQYSLAITYVELRTGRLPFDETMTPYQVMEAHVLQTLDFRRLPEPERMVIERATATDPEARWSSSRDMILALRQAVASTGELPLRPGEAAFSGGITPTHAITGRPMARDTSRHTQVKADPHKETSIPRGHTPSQSLLQKTAHMTPGRASDPLAETSMLPPSDFVPPPAKTSRGLWYGIGSLAAAAVVLAVLMVVLKKDKPVDKPLAQGGNGKQSATNGTEGADEVDSNNPNAQYIKAVQQQINGGKWNAAVDLLGKSPSGLPAFEKEALQHRLTKAFISALDTRIESRDYPLALALLKGATSGIGLSEQDKQQQRDKIRTAWLTQADEEFQNEQFPRALETAQMLLNEFPADRDGMFIVSRCNVRQNDNSAAATTLEKLGKTAELPSEYRPLHTGLLLLAKGSEAAQDADWIKLLDGFVEFIPLGKDTTPPPSLKLNTWEIGRLTGLRSRTTEQIQEMLASLPAEQAKPLLEKLEKLGGSSDLQMSKVKLLLDDKQFADARKTLDDLATSADNDELKAEIAATTLLVELLDPATKPEDATRAIDEAGKTIGNMGPALRSELCAAAEKLALGAQPDLLTSVIGLVSKARDLDPLDQPMMARLARLWAARLTSIAAQPSPPSKAELPSLLQSCELVEAAGLTSGTVDAFHAECLLAANSRDRQLLTTLIERAKPIDPYVQFVQARVLRSLPQPNWDEIAKLLTACYSKDDELPPAVDAPYRRAAAAKLLGECAAKQRVASANDPGAILANPFVSAAAADAAFPLLQLRQTLLKDIDAAELKPTDAEQRESSINLALASLWKSKPDDALAQSQTGALAKLTDSELGASAFPLLLAVFRANEGKSGDQTLAVDAMRRLIELFQKRFPIADAQAVELYKQVLQPALALADSLAAAKKSSGIDKLYAAAADFIGHYKRAAWPFADKEAEIEKLMSQAIAIDPKVAKYFTSRGVARVSQHPPNIEGALADANQASTLDPNLPGAFSLQGHALIYRSRQQATRTGRLADLDQAVAKATAAVAASEKSKPDDPDRAMYLLYTSMALLEKANFETESKLKQQLLEKAVTYAEQAVALEKDKAYPDYAYTALGNALEDLAWMAGVEPEKNYQAAIDAFAAAIASNPASPDPWIGRARCFYKALADSKLDPQFLQRTKEEAFQVAISDLDQAKQLNPNLIEPYLWLGKAYQQLGKFAEADEALSKAVDLADKQQLPERAIYLFDWARNATMNSSVTAEERGKLVKLRAEKLKAAPNLGGTSNAKQAAILIGESLVAEKKFADAIKEYDAVLADYDKPENAKQPLDPAQVDGADVSLFLARAFTRLNLPDSQWNLTAAEAVIKDAARVAQLKPDPKYAALASWYAARARVQSIPATSPTLTEFKKQSLDPAIADIRKAIQLAPSDPGSWDWRSTGAYLIGARISLPTTVLPPLPPDKLKALAAEARRWINGAIDMASKRPDLANQMSGLQRKQEDLEKSLKAKGL